MEIAEGTRPAFEEFLKEMNFDEKLAAVFKQAEMDLNSAETYEELKSVYHRYLTSIKDLVARSMDQFTAHQMARKICDDLEIGGNEKDEA